ncbi:Uncharacterised protein [Serratia liquefaciens]|nr:Uncharacterised protein [Serratia liquefaciens]
MLLSFQFCLALYFFLCLLFQLLFEGENFGVVAILTVLRQHKNRHRKVVIFGYQPVIPDGKTETQAQAHLGIIQIIMVFVDGLVTNSAQFMEYRKDVVINKGNFAQFTQKIVLILTEGDIQQQAKVFSRRFAKHTHFHQCGVGIIRVIIFRRTGDGIGEIVDALQELKIGFSHH